MGFGTPNEQHPWTVDYDTSLAIVGEAIDAGITFFDTAYSYNNGTSEEYLGRALRACASRDKVQIATKCPPPSADTREQGFTDGGWVRYCLETSLARLGEDYVDLFICHWWGDDCDMNEVFATMSALAAGSPVCPSTSRTASAAGLTISGCQSTAPPWRSTNRSSCG